MGCYLALISGVVMLFCGFWRLRNCSAKIKLYELKMLNSTSIGINCRSLSAIKRVHTLG